MDRLTYLNNGNAAYITALYTAYQHDPESIEFGWQKFFDIKNGAWQKKVVCFS
jgi:2-oxoglutarate dehydrogenase E1 component